MKTQYQNLLGVVSRKSIETHENYFILLDSTGEYYSEVANKDTVKHVYAIVEYDSEQPYIREKPIQAKISLLEKYTGYKLDYEIADVYGGYRLVRMQEDDRNVPYSHVFGISSCGIRLPYYSFMEQLNAIIGTIEELKLKRFG